MELPIIPVAATLAEKLRSDDGKRSKESVKIEFSEFEIEEMRQQFMDLSTEIIETEAEKKKAMANFTNKLKGLKFDTDRLLRICNDGYEYQNRDCVLKANDLLQTIEIYDATTSELLGSRPQEPEEKIFTVSVYKASSKQSEIDDNKDDAGF